MPPGPFFSSRPVGNFFGSKSALIPPPQLLGPIVWHAWVYAGTANANFYYGVTLVQVHNHVVHYDVMHYYVMYYVI